MKLTQLIAQYVAFRKSLGQDFESDEKRLRTFSRFIGESADIRSVKPPRVAAFLAGRGPLTRYWHLKYGTLRGFFSYTATRGYLSTSPLPANVPKPPARFVPYIYSREELRRILDGTASYQKHKTRIVMEPHTFRAILLLLYGAALRVSEALSLNLADVDLEEAVTVIRDTKFYKTRLVPLGSDLNDVMTQYAMQRKRDGHSQSNNAPFFVTRFGARISSRLLRSAFQRLRTHSGVRRPGGPHEPRLHAAACIHIRRSAWYGKIQRCAGGIADDTPVPVMFKNRKPYLTEVACWAHAGRYFFGAQIVPRVGFRPSGGGKSRSRFAAKRGGVFSLYTIPLWHLLEDGWLWQPLGRALPSPTAKFLRRRAAASSSTGWGSNPL